MFIAHKVPSYCHFFVFVSQSTCESYVKLPHEIEIHVCYYHMYRCSNLHVNYMWFFCKDIRFKNLVPSEPNISDTATTLFSIILRYFYLSSFY
jgi:hypothetical protein